MLLVQSQPSLQCGEIVVQRKDRLWFDGEERSVPLSHHVVWNADGIAEYLFGPIQRVPVQYQ